MIFLSFSSHDIFFVFYIMLLPKFIPTVRNFTALARTVASNWRVVDAITLSYCNSVAKVLKERHVELVNKFRLLPQYPKEQQQKKKESTKPTTITTAAATTPVVTKTMTPPFAGANINSSSQQNQQSLVDMHINNFISPVLMLKQPVKKRTTPRSLYNIHQGACIGYNYTLSKRLRRNNVNEC